MRQFAFLFIILAALASSALIGCDTTAERELNRAEVALDKALDVNADAYASDDYMAAEELLIEASDLAKDSRIQEARAAAIKSKLRAEDAERKALERHKIMEAEMERLGR